MSHASEHAKRFLAEAPQFKLGMLPTEARHPKTTRLSQLAQDDPPAAIKILNEIDIDVVKVVANHISEIDGLARTIRETLSSGRRIFLCGCGATGRLSVSLEALWREHVKERKTEYVDSVRSFIAGGDFALVRSIENFEDHPHFGRRQLLDLGFSEGDLLISTTEGGETPFVIGATEEAARKSSNHPYFLYCNPSDLLQATVERSQRVIENGQIKKICLATGPMALAGSTRMQATTVLMLAVGAALFSQLDEGNSPQDFVNELLEALSETDMTALAPLIERESALYASGQYCVHRTNDYGMTVLTDTTERTPTFSIMPFESITDEEVKPSWTYLCVAGADSSERAWEKVLHRSPRALEWPEIVSRFGIKKTLSYDFSTQALQRRRRSLGAERVHAFDIFRDQNQIRLSLQGLEAQLKRPRFLLVEHLLLKCALNASSTLVMGRLGRFKSNLMLFVRPTNKKLIDRSIRFVQILLKDDGLDYSYEDICFALLEVFDHLPQDEPVVLRTFERLRDRANAKNSGERTSADAGKGSNTKFP